MSSYAMRTRSGLVGRTRTVDLAELWWLAFALVVAFLVPFVLADRLELQRDVYYGVYGVVAIGLFLLWVRVTGASLQQMLRRRWILAVALGLASAAVMALIVVRTEDSTARPGGLELAGALLWRGVLYGVADGVLLSAFPILVVYAAFSSSPINRLRLGRIAIGLAALAASLAMTATYHAGYGDFRSAKVRSPLAGDVVWSVPTLVTLNPVGAPVAHVGLHVTAVIHSSETDTFLPPHE